MMDGVEGTQLGGNDEPSADAPFVDPVSTVVVVAENQASSVVIALSGIAMVVSVDEPRQMGSGMAKYFTFPVSVKLDQMVACFKLTEFGVDRRFSQFEMLYKHLVIEFPGSIVPLLPSKGTAGVNYAVNMDARRQGLETFLRRVCADSELSTSSYLTGFLESDQALGTVESEVKANTTKPSSWWSKAVAKPKAMEMSAEDVAMQKAGASSEELEAKLKALRAASSTLATRQGEHGLAMERFGAALDALSKVEGDVELSKVIALVGESAVAAAAIDANLAGQIEERLGLPTADMARTCNAVKLALQRRVGTRNAVCLALSDVDAKVAAHKKADESLSTFAVGVRTEKMIAKVTAAAAAEETAKAGLVAAEEALEFITAKLTANLERHHAEQTAAKMGAMRSLIAAHIEANKAAAARWEELAAEVEAKASTEELAAEVEAKASTEELAVEVEAKALQ